MSLTMKPKSLEMVDLSRATVHDRIVLELPGGFLNLQFCKLHRHAEGGEHTFCVGPTSSHRSLWTALREQGYCDKDGKLLCFPHISLVGLPGIGDHPRVEIWVDRRLQRRALLQTCIADFHLTNNFQMVEAELDTLFSATT